MMTDEPHDKPDVSVTLRMTGDEKYQLQCLALDRKRKKLDGATMQDIVRAWIRAAWAKRESKQCH